MKKYITIVNALEALRILSVKKRLEGVLYIDQNTGRLMFKAYNRKPRLRLKDRLIRILEHGWVKESEQRVKVYESIPKNLGTARIMRVLDREIKEAESALIDREIIDNV